MKQTLAAAVEARKQLNLELRDKNLSVDEREQLTGYKDAAMEDEKALTKLGSRKHLQLEIIYGVLQNVSINIYRNRKRQWEEQGRAMLMFHQMNSLLLAGRTTAVGTATKRFIPQQLRFAPSTKMNRRKRRGTWSDILNEKCKIQATQASRLKATMFSHFLE